MLVQCVEKKLCFSQSTALHPPPICRCERCSSSQRHFLNEQKQPSAGEGEGTVYINWIKTQFLWTHSNKVKMAIWISKIFWRYNKSIICKIVTEKHNTWIICYILNYRIEWQHRLTSRSHMLGFLLSLWSLALVTPSHIGPRSVSYPINALSFCAIWDILLLWQHSHTGHMGFYTHAWILYAF